MFRKTKIGILILLGMLCQEPVRAQVVNIVDQAARSMAGEHFQDRMMNLATEDAGQFNQVVSDAKDQAAAEKAMKLYQSKDMRFVEHSWKFNDSKPRDYFRTQTANALEILKNRYGIVPERNFIERFIIWIDGISS